MFIDEISNNVQNIKQNKTKTKTREQVREEVVVDSWVAENGYSSTSFTRLTRHVNCLHSLFQNTCTVRGYKYSFSRGESFSKQ